MPLIFSLALLLAAPPAVPAESFAARVMHGKMIEVGPSGGAYQKAMWDQLNAPVTAALKGCLAQHAPAVTSPFTLVANVLANGPPAQVVAQPATPVARCLADWFATQKLPQPPSLAGEPVYPIEIDFSITP